MMPEMEEGKKASYRENEWRTNLKKTMNERIKEKTIR